MKKANFDVSHELDEFLMVEKPLTHSKRKANPDLEKMKPELRQLEEQYGLPSPPVLYFADSFSVNRFTVYDFTKPNRISYYPHNEPIVTSNHQEEGDPSTVIQSATNTLIPNGTLIDRSQARSPSPQDGMLDRSMACSPPLQMIASDAMGESRASMS